MDTNLDAMIAATDKISNQATIKDVLKGLNEKGYSNFTGRPWNQFKPGTTLWWLVPSTNWPAYKHGKLVWFRQGDNFRTGFHLEKGISDQAAQLEKNLGRLRMEPDWIWHNFIKDLSNGTFEQKLTEISRTADKPLNIVIQATNVINGDDPYSVKMEEAETENVITFQYKDNELNCLLDETKGELSKLKNIKKISDLKIIFENHLTGLGSMCL